MVEVADICAKVISKSQITIATDNIFNKKICKKFGYNCKITPKNCKTGTDRVFYAAKKIKSDFFINVQGDEPLIDPRDIKKIIQAKKNYKNHIICGYCDVNYKRCNKH